MHGTSIVDEPGPKKLGDCYMRKVDRRPMEGGCHRPSTHHPHAFVGGSAGGSSLPNVVQFHGFKRGGPTCTPADNNRETHQGL